MKIIPDGVIRCAASGGRGGCENAAVISNCGVLPPGWRVVGVGDDLKVVCSEDCERRLNIAREMTKSL